MKNCHFVALLLLSATMLFAAGQGEQGKDKDKVTIRWMVGLGSGADEQVQQPQKDLVAKFNKTHKDIKLVVEFIANAEARQLFATQLAAGNPADICGPLGIEGRDGFRDAWLDLDPVIKEYGYDMSDFTPEIIDFFRVDGYGLQGIPFAIYPSFIYINKKLFDEAGLPYPPQKYGAPYVDEKGVSHEWNIDTLEMLAKKLTVDSNGNDATSPNFDAGNIVQFGFGNQWTWARASATLFGAGSVIDNKGNAVIPEHWKTAFKWYYDAMWKSHFYPNQAYSSSDLFGNEDWFPTGNFAMVNCHLWLAGYMGEDVDFPWDTACVPSYKGKTTAKLHADTFEITKTTKHPREAFVVLDWLTNEAAKDLTNIYGGIPCRKSLATIYNAKTWGIKNYPKQNINWQVVDDSSKYADIPSHEGYMPNFQKALLEEQRFWAILNENDSLNIDQEIEIHRKNLQAIFDEEKK